MKIFTLIILFFAAFAVNAQLVDPDLETGAVGYWSESSTNFGTPLCTEALCGNGGGGAVAHSGDWYAWFGGANAPEEGHIGQTLTIPNGSSAEISFWVSLPTPGNGLTADFLKVTLDGVELLNINATDSADYTSYTEVTVSISPFADGNEHYLEARGVQSTSTSVNFILDDFDMVVDGNSAVGVNELLNQENDFAVYPNPAVNELNLLFNRSVSNLAEVKIYALSGKLISSQTLQNTANKTFTLDTTNLESGIYLVEVESDGEIAKQRFVVEK